MNRPWPVLLALALFCLVPTTVHAACDGGELKKIEKELAGGTKYKELAATLQTTYDSARQDAGQANGMFNTPDGKGFRPENADAAIALLKRSNGSIRSVAKTHERYHRCMRFLFVSLDTQYVDNLRNLSMIAMTKSQMDSAMKYRQQLVSVADTSRGSIKDATSLGLDPKMYAAFDQSMRRNLVEAHLFLGLDHAKAKNKKKAKTHFKQAIALETDPTAKDRLKKIRDGAVK